MPMFASRGAYVGKPLHLRIFADSFNDFYNSVLADDEITGDPAIAIRRADSVKTLQCNALDTYKKPQN